MSQDTFVPSGGQAPSGGGAAPGRTPIDRFEMKQQFIERREEEQAEAAAILYEKAARERFQSGVPETQELDEEELAAMSQELKLKQMCQDIAALIMVDELEEDSDEE